METRKQLELKLMKEDQIINKGLQNINKIMTSS
jgi:hypothetical protein